MDNPAEVDNAGRDQYKTDQLSRRKNPSNLFFLEPEPFFHESEYSIESQTETCRNTYTNSFYAPDSRDKKEDDQAIETREELGWIEGTVFYSFFSQSFEDRMCVLDVDWGIGFFPVTAAVK